MSLPDSQNIALVRQMMATLGVTTADLAAPADGAEDHGVVGGPMPTVREYHATILELATPGQQRTYANHWRHLVESYGDRRIDSLRKTELEVLSHAAKRGARTRANSRNGTGAQENCVAALRHFFAKAVDDGWLRDKRRKGQPVGRRLTYRRYDNLYARWQAALPWADQVHVSGHWLRHTAVAEVERLAGFGTARKFAGHRDESAATTLTYIRADDQAVAAATALRSGEAHPLAPHALSGPAAPDTASPAHG